MRSKSKKKRKRKQKRTAPKPKKRKRQTPTALVPVAPAPIARREHGLRPEQVALLKRTVAKDTTPDEFALFMLVARKHKLDPFTRQLHCVKRWSTEAGTKVMAIQIGIDGYRAMAARSHKDFGSIGEPEYEYGTDPKIPILARIRLWKKGVEQPTVAVAFWAEIAPKDINAKEAWAWKKMPRHMLAKCAEAFALRKAYPDLADIYTDEEMAQADIDLSPEGREVTDLEGRPLSAPALPPAPPQPDPPADPPIPTDPPAGTLAKINRYQEVIYRKGNYVKVEYGNWECTCWKKNLWPYLKAGEGELAILIVQRNGKYLNIMGIKSIGAQTFSEVEGKSVPDRQVSDEQPQARVVQERLARAVARPATRDSKKILITYKGDFAEVSGDTVALRERIVDGMAGKRDEERKLYVIPAAWVPTLQAVCDDEGIEVEEKDPAMA
jgi:phage recombination protein Bet